MNLLEIIKENLVEDECLLTNNELSERLDVSVSSIKRKLNTLEEEGKIIIKGSGKARKLYYRPSTGSTGSLAYDIFSSTGSDTILTGSNITSTGSDTISTGSVDLSSIPEKYHPIFTTDWNEGSRSTMNWKQRLEIHKLFLEYNHQEKVVYEL
jgi:biotin operon repressor